MKPTVFILLVITILFSCVKERKQLPFHPKSIAELTANMEGDIKRLSKLRLSFGIAFSKALEDIEFRDYVYSLSKENTDSFFNEIVFALHKDDKAVGNKTLATVINDAAVDEVKEMYGDDFINIVLENDPLVSIKIPDVFYDFNWETGKYAPMVAIKTPGNVGENKYLEYLGYHYSGYIDYYFPLKFKNYFTIVVKYSEDYILYNKSNNLNEKNIQLFELMPQLEMCWEYMSDYLVQTGIQSPVLDNMIYIKRRDIAEEFLNNCVGNYIYYGEMVMANCKKECIKDCISIDNDDKISDVIENVAVANPLMIDFFALEFFQDNFDIFFFTFNPNGEIIDKYMITGYRKSEYYGRDISFDKDIKEERYEIIGNTIIPRVKINLNYTSPKNVFINHRFRKGWGKDTNGFVMQNFSCIRYSDIVRKYPIDYSLSKNPLILNCTELLGIDQSPTYYCQPPSPNDYVNISSLFYTYRY